MVTDRLPSKQRKSLKQSLKELLKLRPLRASPPRINSVGSGILRKAQPSIGQSHHTSTVSLFPDFGCSQSDVNNWVVNTAGNHAQQHDEASLRQGRTLKHPSLLPATSLSQFRLHDTFRQQGSVPRHSVYGHFANTKVSIASQQASFSSVHTPQLYRSASTLRLHESKSTLTSLRKPSQQTVQRVPSVDQIGNNKPTSLSDAGPNGSLPNVHAPWHLPKGRTGSPLTSVDHFKSFCVLDTAVPGCPVTATSSELRYIFEIGEQFFLDNQECHGTSIDIVTGSDAIGNEITHLVLFSPLIAPSSGRSRFMFASLIDVTRFIEEAATLPELDTISEEASTIDELATPPSYLNQVWPTVSHELSVEDLLGGCWINDVTPRRKPMESDIWLHLAASEERSRQPSPQSRNASRVSQNPSTPSPKPRTPTNGVDEVLEQFVGDLQTLYSDFFLLGKSPLDHNVYEICNVSAKVYASKDYIDGHLSKTPRETIEALSARLSQSSAFSMPVKWGLHGDRKQLYCSPVYGQHTLTWICFLVDENIPLLW